MKKDAKATREHRAMTTQAMRALKEREEAKRKQAEKKNDNSQTLYAVLGGVVVLFILVNVLFFSGEQATPAREGEEKGRKEAAAHIEKGHFVLHLVEGEAMGVKDHGKEWEKVLRGELQLKVYITRHGADATEREGFVDYLKAYNTAMLEHLRDKLGSAFLEQARDKALKRQKK